MTEKEIKVLAREYIDSCTTRAGFVILPEGIKSDFIDLFVAGFMKCLEQKATNPKWHKVADGDLPKGEEFGKNSVHRKIYLKDRYGNLYTGNYYPKDDTHKEDCFAVEFLDWGLQGSQFCAKEQISKWCEIPQYTEE